MKVFNSPNIFRNIFCLISQHARGIGKSKSDKYTNNSTYTVETVPKMYLPPLLKKEGLGVVDRRWRRGG